ncbi:MAG: 6-pyruvoyl-tetrahydropterin synthase-related protein [Lentisphaerae bacterium]|nr:6-pyruvoyl-tetrahydropterin synthase-related protein [Lentisphaerota bacterium]
MGKRKISILIDLTVILAVSLALLSGLIFSDNWPLSHDALRYLCHLDQFKDAFDAGILYPRWFPNYYGGYGYPIFIFYQPAYFFFSLPFTYFTPDILTASYASNVAMFFLGGAGVYFLIRRITSARLVSLFCAMMFLLTPYVYVNIYVRGDLAELLAMFITPWALYFLMRLKDRISENTSIAPFILTLSLVLAAMVYSHPFTSMFFYPIFCVIMVAMGLEMDRKTAAKFLTAGGISIVLAVIFSSPYWLTAFQMKEYVEYQNAGGGYLAAENNVVYFQQLFSRFWGFGGSEPGTANDGMSFQLGLPHFIAALLGFWLNRKNKFYLSIFLLYILSILMMTPLASLLWENIPMLNFVQFPWRLLSVIALLQIICISGLWKLKELCPGRKTVYHVLAFIFVFTVLWNSNQFEFVKFKFDVRKAIERHREVRLEKLLVYESFNEFLPKTVSGKLLINPRADRPMLEVSNPSCRIEEYPYSNPHHLRYRITNRQPQTVVINQLYFPGWKVVLNDKAFDDAYLLRNICKDGRIQIEIPSGENMYFEAFYDGPPGWHIRNIIVFSLFITLLVFVAAEHRRYSGMSIRK